MKPVQIIEHVFYPETDGFPEEHKGDNVFFVDLDKVEEFAKNHDFEYSYVASIIEAIVTGKFVHDRSQKYSFSDAEEWYEELFIKEPVAGDVKTVEYTVYI